MVEESDSAGTTLGDLTETWPGPVPRNEIAIWTTMPAADRTKALRRLSAATSYEASGRRDVPRHADMAGVGEPRFYKMMRDWRRDASLLALVPQAARRAPRAFAPPAGIEEAAMEAVRADHLRVGDAVGDAGEADGPDSTEVVAAALHERFGAPSISWIRRLVARARRDYARELAGGPAGFGRRIVIDSAALPLPLLPYGIGEASDLREAREEGIEWAVAAFVWDGATGFILGHALDRAPADIRLHMSAARAASEFLRGLTGEGVDVAGPEMASTLPLEDRAYVETMRLIAKMDSVGVSAIHSARAQGSELMAAFAGRLASLELRPRFAADTFAGRTTRADALGRSDRIPMSLEAARLVLDVEVEKQNAETSGVSAVPAVAPRVIADALDRLVAAIGAEED